MDSLFQYMYISFHSKQFEVAVFIEYCVTIMFLVKSNYIFKNLQFVRGPLFFLLTFAHENAATPASCSPISKIA